MPRIPIITAQEGPGILNLPPVQRMPGFEQMTQAGERLNAIREQLQAQQDRLDLEDLSSRFDYALSDAKLNLRQNPDYAQHTTQFLQDAADIQAKMAAQPGSPIVQRAFAMHAQQRVLHELVNVKTDALKLQHGDQLVRLDDKSIEIANRIAIAPNEQAAEEYKKTFGDMLRGTPGLTPAEIGTRWEKFLKHVDHSTALHQLQTDPEAFQVKIGMLTTNDNGDVVYEHFPHLTEEQRFTLSNNARVMAEHAALKQKQAANDAKDEQLSSILIGVAKKTIPAEQLPTLLSSMDPARITHGFNFLASQQSHERETTRFNEQQAANTFLVSLPLANEQQVKAVVKKAELAFAARRIDEASLYHIKETAQQQLTHVRREARDAEGDQERVLRREYAAAQKEIQGWLGVDIHGPGAQFIRDDYQSAVKDLESIGANAVMEGQSPRQAMRQAVPDTMVKLFGGLDAAEKEMWARMAPIKSEADYADAIRSGRIVDPVQRVRMARAYEVLKYIQQWRQRSQPPAGR